MIPSDQLTQGRNKTPIGTAKGGWIAQALGKSIAVGIRKNQSRDELALIARRSGCLFHDWLKVRGHGVKYLSILI